jgi:hypothetical protein
MWGFVQNYGGLEAKVKVKEDILVDFREYDTHLGAYATDETRFYITSQGRFVVPELRSNEDDVERGLYWDGREVPAVDGCEEKCLKRSQRCRRRISSIGHGNGELRIRSGVQPLAPSVILGEAQLLDLSAVI